jgi:hypothetical protein
MADPASLNVNLEIVGMDEVEASAALLSLRAGASGQFDVSQPALGGRRYRLTAVGLSVGAVGDLMKNVAINHDDASALGIQEGGSNGQ